MKRFWEKVKKTEDCWIWQGAGVKNRGYGLFWYQGKLQGAHRIAYQLRRGAIPSDRELDHLCHNPSCVNPDHLEIVTRQENQRRSSSFSGLNSQKDKCAAGHDFNIKNTYLRPDNKGRECRTCRNETNKRLYGQKVAVV